ncbi:MAG TPA: helix-turn-helix domain-containing protein [Gemmatimonadaceae bacterium]|nr:helix-turn-helix domain-containing protein [Gemmatimonadaceae bacterium]
MISVATMLTPGERTPVDAAGNGSYHALHRDSVSEVIDDLKSKRADAVLVSVARCDAPTRPSIQNMLHEFPRVPTVALLSASTPEAPGVALCLGTSGIKELVDVRQASGWRDLRRFLMRYRAADIQREALAQLAIDLAGAPDDCWRFFEALFLAPPCVSTIRALSEMLDVLPSTLMSRFFRAKLPAPKRYLAMARLVRAARLFENPGLSVANVANHMDYSSPQSFGRHVRALTQMTAGGFREHFDGTRMLHQFRVVMMLPHLDRLLKLRPLSNPNAPVSGSGQVH